MIAAGQSFLHFRIEQKLGEGGMGVVWRATDTSLGRSVAIKVLPQEFAADPERLARFEREARMLATLNHPNIATVYSVHADGDVRCLAMELVPGEDLSQRIARGPLPVAEALEIARQIALALEAAHDHGVVHRDLKPANVRLTPDGRVKVLDFGLAKAMEGAAPTTPLSQSPTMAGSLMTSGAIIGTAAYMSPEQARGQAADRRADIWAFGVVLYEMLSGHRAFEGDTVSDILASVLKSEPDRTRLPQAVPARIRRLLDRCLEKSPRARLRDIGEALLAIEDELAGKPDAAAAVAEAASSRHAAMRRERLLWAAGVVGVTLLAFVLGSMFRRGAPESAGSRKLGLVVDEGTGLVGDPLISPDGTKIAYVVQNHLWVRDLEHGTSRQLVEEVEEAFRPAWSPDSRAIVFARSGGLSRVSVASADVSPICSVEFFSGGSGGSWGEDDRIVFARGRNHIFIVPASGGTPEVFVARDDSLDNDLHQPFLLPGNRGVLYVRHLRHGPAKVLAVAHGGVKRDILTLQNAVFAMPLYDPRGFILYTQSGEGAGIWAVPFSIERLQVTGEPFLLTAEGSAVSLSARGELLYLPHSISLQAAVVRVDRTGKVLARLTDSITSPWSLALSPDERWLAVESREAGEGDVWLYDLVRHSAARFAFGPGIQGEPEFSPDGRSLVWSDIQERSLKIRPIDGSIPARKLTQGFRARFTPDGRHLVYHQSDTGPEAIWYRSLDEPADSLKLTEPPVEERYPMPAPHGPYLAFLSSETGQEELYLRRYPEGGSRWRVSSGAALVPIWSRRGDRLYYWQNDAVYEVPVTLEPEVRIGTPRVLLNFRTAGLQSRGRYNFIPTSNPDQFLALREVENDRPASNVDAVLVEDWTAEFVRKK